MYLYKTLQLFTLSLISCLFISTIVVTVQSDEAKIETLVSQGKQVSIEYTLTLDDKSIVDSNIDTKPLSFVQGSHEIIPGLENALEGMKVGESKKVTVKPEDAYGLVNKDAVSEVKKEQVPQDALKVVAVLQGQSPDGRVILTRVIEIKEETVLLDYNHPLAGQTLYFDVKILDVQEALTPTS
ncbi:MAG: peptidylprolyl isomerase [Candidatus Brocadiaceae bacterium]|nr:peptidylprolyl isomerase [Candidatus Brocadiaceae bacterium]